MKKLLLMAFISISFQLVSQNQGEMKYINTNLVEYNGERIKIKEAKKMAKESYPLAFKQFKRAQINRGLAIASGVLWLGTEILHQFIKQDNEDNLDLNDAKDAFERGYMEAEANGLTYTTIVLPALCSASRQHFIHLGVKAFNEGK